MFTKKREIFLTRIDRQAMFTKKSERDFARHLLPKGGPDENVLGHRDARGKSQGGNYPQGVSFKSGMCPSFLSEVENGLRPAPKDEPLLIRIADALGLDASSVKEAASNDRARRDLKLLKELFTQDDELAACYCRAKEMYNETELKKLFKEIFTRATSHGKEGQQNE